MLKTYLKVVWRNLIGHPVYTLLNVGGLALGIAAAFVLGLYAHQELTYDRHFEGSDRIYRVATDFYDMGGFANSQQQLLDVLPPQAPFIEASTRFARGAQAIRLDAGTPPYEEARAFFADSAFFQVFSYRFLAGSPSDALRAPDEVVLSDKLARVYFGQEPALGRVLLVGPDQTPHRVTGVVQAPPGKTHLAADLWLPLVPEEPDAHWTNVAYYNYVRLRAGSPQADLEGALDQLVRRAAYPASGFDGPLEAWRAAPQGVRLWAQPLTDIYLHSDLNFEITPGGNPAQVYTLALIGVFILLIAGMNYVNLATARASIRAKEVGVKKTLGAGPSALAQQFLTETVVLGLLATLLAAVFAESILSAFAFVTGETLATGVFADGRALLMLLASSLLVGLAASLYPAFYLSSFRPAQILKGTWTPSGNRRLRSTLVVVQFTLAIALIVSSLVVYRQLDFMLHADKGFEHEGVLVVEQVDALGPQADAFRQRLEWQPQVARASFARRVPTGSGVWMTNYRTPEMDEALTLQTFAGDEDYVPTLGLRLVAGRNFSGELASDSSALILNEAAVHALGLGDEPIGREVSEGQRVIGVVRDFHFQSLRQQIAPAVLTYSALGDELALKVEGRDVPAFMERLPGLWHQFAPGVPLRYAFLEDNVAELARKEQALSKAVSFFTFLALVIAVMGLFGLAAFTTERRTKELGVRKVLGASALSLVGLLSKDFARLVLVAFMAATPLAYLAMEHWLGRFAYRVDLGPGVFLLAGTLALAVALLTVGSQAVKAALADPVQSLRYE